MGHMVTCCMWKKSSLIFPRLLVATIKQRHQLAMRSVGKHVNGHGPDGAKGGAVHVLRTRAAQHDRVGHERFRGVARYVDELVDNAAAAQRLEHRRVEARARRVDDGNDFPLHYRVRCIQYKPLPSIW